jgi:hypothetical protein
MNLKRLRKKAINNKATPKDPIMVEKFIKMLFTEEIAMDAAFAGMTATLYAVIGHSRAGRNL